MLEPVSEQVRECHERAAEAKGKAEATADPALKAEFLDIERRWLALARSHTGTESLEDFRAANTDRRRKFDERGQGDAGPDAALRLQQISTLLIQGGNLHSLYDRILDAAIASMSADMASMQIFRPELKELHLLAWRGFHPESAAFWERVRFNSASTCGLALSAGSRIIVPDIETCDFMAGTSDLDEYRRSHIRAVQSTPLTSRSGQLLGMISTHWREPHQPKERTLRRLDVLARQAAALSNVAEPKPRCEKVTSNFGGSPPLLSAAMTQSSASPSMASSRVGIKAQAVSSAIQQKKLSESRSRF